MKTYNRVIFTSLSLVALLGLLYGCSSNGFKFGWGQEVGSTPAAEPPTTASGGTPENPFIPAEPTPVVDSGGNPIDPTEYTESFTQSLTSKVDIVWMIDSSGSMKNNQTAIANNAALFTGRLSAASVDFKLMVVTSDPASSAGIKNKCSGGYITSANYLTNKFETCAIVGINGSGLEEGLESVRRALDPNYPNGPWASATTANPANPGFLRDDADLQIVYVSDEEDEPDDRYEPGTSSWSGRAGVTDADIVLLRNEMSSDLADGGHLFDTRYAFFPFVANHVAFLNGLKASGTHKVRAHAIVTTLLDGSDSCHTRGITEEVGERYKATARLMGGSTSDLCGSWSTTMDNLGLQATGLEKCFRLAHEPTQRASIEVKVDATPLTINVDFEFVPTGTLVCLASIPPAGSVIEITYK